jgi:hypothetical protein
MCCTIVLECHTGGQKKRKGKMARAVEAVAWGLMNITDASQAFGVRAKEHPP